MVLANTAALGAAGTAIAVNGGTLDLATNATVNAYNVAIGGSAAITSDLANSGAGIAHTLGTLSIGNYILTIGGSSNVTSGTAGVTFGAVTQTGTPTYTVNNPVAVGTTTLLTVAGVSGAYTATINGSGNVAQTGVWGTGTGGITYSGTGTLTLNQANTFSGILTVGSGMVVGTTSAAALGAGTLTLSGGTLSLTNAPGTNLSFGRNTTITAASTITSDVTSNGVEILTH